ncbi:hypothetical protein B0H13DRAFT_1856436 [Mycena leptocephala]|nr:hypothetical protein B0H13DRAFT_1856436 [Mycena leptocephala]
MADVENPWDFDNALEDASGKVCDAPSFNITEEFDEISAAAEVVGDTDIEVIEVTNVSLLAKLEDNKEIEGINELEIVSVVAAANLVLPEFGSEPHPNLNRTRTAPEFRFEGLEKSEPNQRLSKITAAGVHVA